MKYFAIYFIKITTSQSHLQMIELNGMGKKRNMYHTGKSGFRFP